MAKLTQANRASDSALAQGTTNRAIAMIKSFTRMFIPFNFSYIKAIVLLNDLKQRIDRKAKSNDEREKRIVTAPQKSVKRLRSYFS
ncbi:hypothetical protein [Pedobacter africanus]|uniref:hypothetical protein n=1 Tax=Pedobacter africanus TaxID=151894 RepID=UPI000A01D8E5|nr:hypothetical protein [Pedobacter africanus]